jgi:hypothetical protein
MVILINKFIFLDKNQTMKKIIIFLLACSTITISCSDDTIEVEKSTELKQVLLTAEDSTCIDPRVKGQGHTGSFAYRIDSANQYSAGFFQNIEDSLIGSSIRVCVNFWAKANDVKKGDCLALSFCKKNGECTWNSFDILNYKAKPNEWINIVDSVTFSKEEFKDSTNLIKVFAFHADKNTIVDFDDITIKIKKIYTVIE